MARTCENEQELAELDTRLLTPFPGAAPSQSALRAQAAANDAMFSAVEADAGDSAAGG